MTRRCRRCRRCWAVAGGAIRAATRRPELPVGGNRAVPLGSAGREPGIIQTSDEQRPRTAARVIEWSVYCDSSDRAGVKQQAVWSNCSDGAVVTTRICRGR